MDRSGGQTSGHAGRVEQKSEKPPGGYSTPAERPAGACTAWLVSQAGGELAPFRKSRSRCRARGYGITRAGTLDNGIAGSEIASRDGGYSGLPRPPDGVPREGRSGTGAAATAPRARSQLVGGDSGFPVFVYGSAVNGLPYLTPRWLARRLAKKKTDYATARFLASVVAVPRICRTVISTRSLLGCARNTPPRPPRSSVLRSGLIPRATSAVLTRLMSSKMAAW